MVGATPMGTTSESQFHHSFVRIKTRRLTGFIAFPTTRRPQLKLAHHANDEGLPVNLRILTELWRNEHSPLTVQGTDIGAGTKVPHEGAGTAIIRQVEQLFLDGEPFGLRIEDQAILEELGDHQGGVVRGIELMQGIPQARRHAEPPLVIQVQVILAEKHLVRPTEAYWFSIFSHFLPPQTINGPPQSCQGEKSCDNPPIFVTLWSL